MRPTFAVAVIFVLMFAQTLDAAESRAGARRPNVILIYSDDQGAVDLGCYGTTDIATPQIDMLFKTGTRFTQMYAPAPVCSASRAGLMTGKIPARAGVPGNVSSTAGVPGMPTGQVTIAEMFKNAGYKTGHFGKWHLGFTPETMPLGQGFDESFGFMGGCIDNWSHFFYWAGSNRHDLWRDGREIFEPGRYFPERMTDECIDFITRNSDEPFFIYMAYNVPHYPLQPTPRWHKHYLDVAPVDVPFVGRMTGQQTMPDADPLTVRSQYTAFVSSMDEQIGRVVRAVEQLGLRDETIIIFQADQGHSFEERTGWGGGNAGIYRGGKFSLFEGGIRVPAIISWPGTVPQSRVCDETAHACDWFATLAALCDIPQLPDGLDGRNIAPVILEQAASPHETLFWQFNNQWAVRRGDWKLLGNASDPSSNAKLPEEDAKLFLVDLKNDPGERKNMAAEHPETVEELLRIQRDYAEYVKSTD